ncbi:Eukaryotic translation initiation factor 3 subunit F-1 [Portunus trituberculatus]|uniref:Eukaryotic translation initiation factor 3 subunit F-1 n=1 Tax=Portunus trituberculatus TaxID=210409 RepID=A0A5B7CLJ9_PORTR|nr:Eukaryotic translation initiation factor 3 subunit F-1 [Portunus trituberculatus]
MANVEKGFSVTLSIKECICDDYSVFALSLSLVSATTKPGDLWECSIFRQDKTKTSTVGVEKGTIEITNCFCVPHNESKEEGYVSASMGVPGRTPGTMFAPIPVEVISYAPEVVGTNATQKSKYSRQRIVEPSTDLHQISEATQNMEATLDALICKCGCATYVDDVLSGKVPADNYIGRELTRMVNQVPKMSAHEFEEMLNTNMKDLLMVIYLSQLTKVNVGLNEKLTMLVATQ